MKTNHKHQFLMGQSKKVSVCGCGKFRHENLDPKDIITEVTHTPMPWTFGSGEKFPFVIRKDADGLGSHIAYIASKEVLCEEHGGTPEANAAFIVRAVNVHEALLARLRTCMAYMEAKGEQPGWVNETKLIIAKAEGK